MYPFDIIPDTHGQSAKLDAALAGLGWRRNALGWTHPDPDRQIVFLGDFIDRGPDNRAVLKTVRELVDAGKAKAIMGNHELNALHFHTMHPDDGQPLRAHSSKNIRQHKTFLDQFPPGDPQTRDVLDWMRSLPLFLEEDGFRAVHACWIDASMDRLKTLTGDGILTEEQLNLRNCFVLWWPRCGRNFKLKQQVVVSLRNQEKPNVQFCAAGLMEKIQATVAPRPNDEHAKKETGANGVSPDKVRTGRRLADLRRWS